VRATVPVGAPSGTHAVAAGFVPGWRMSRVGDPLASTALVPRDWTASWLLMPQANRCWRPTRKASAHVSKTV
jgi:hypothetical protein